MAWSHKQIEDIYRVMITPSQDIKLNSHIQTKTTIGNRHFHSFINSVCDILISVKKEEEEIGNHRRLLE